MLSQELTCQSPWTLNKLQLHTDWNFMIVTRWAPSDGKTLSHDTRLPSWTFSYHQLIIDGEVTFCLTSQGLFQGFARLHICSHAEECSIYAHTPLGGWAVQEGSMGHTFFHQFFSSSQFCLCFQKLNSIKHNAKNLTVNDSSTHQAFICKSILYTWCDVSETDKRNKQNSMPVHRCNQTVLQVASHIWVLCDITVHPRPVAIHASCTVRGSERVWVQLTLQLPQKNGTIMKKILNNKHYKLLLTINMSVV